MIDNIHQQCVDFQKPKFRGCDITDYQTKGG